MLHFCYTPVTLVKANGGAGYTLKKPEKSVTQIRIELFGMSAVIRYTKVDVTLFCVTLCTYANGGAGCECNIECNIV
jgi:hypothetical protein